MARASEQGQCVLSKSRTARKRCWSNCVMAESVFHAKWVAKLSWKAALKNGTAAAL